MNFVKAYDQASGRASITPDGSIDSFSANPSKESPDEIKERLNDNAARMQAKHQWMQSSISQEFLVWLKKEQSKLLEETMLGANAFAVNGNYQHVVNKAVKASQLAEIIHYLQNI